MYRVDSRLLAVWLGLPLLPLLFTPAVTAPKSSITIVSFALVASRHTPIVVAVVAKQLTSLCRLRVSPHRLEGLVSTSPVSLLPSTLSTLRRGLACFPLDYDSARKDLYMGMYISLPNTSFASSSRPCPFAGPRPSRRRSRHALVCVHLISRRVMAITWYVPRILIQLRGLMLRLC